jgi:eukaryotic-like serine/threonine-protein kinase
MDLADAALAIIDTADPSVLSEPAVAMRTSWAKAQRAHASGDLGRQLEWRKAALAACERCGDQRNWCSAALNLGIAYAILGDFDRAEVEAKRAAAIAERLGLSYVVAACKNCLGLVIAQRDNDFDLARKLEHEAIEAFTGRELRFEGGSRVRLAIVDTMAGDYAAAEAGAMKAMEVLPAASSIRIHALAVMARARLLAGRVPEAWVAAKQAMQAYVAFGHNTEEGDALIGLVYAEALEARGDHEGAREAIGKARDRLLTRAANVTDAKLRGSFLEKIPENARTLALAETWGA